MAYFLSVKRLQPIPTVCLWHDQPGRFQPFRFTPYVGNFFACDKPERLFLLDKVRKDLVAATTIDRQRAGTFATSWGMNKATAISGLDELEPGLAQQLFDVCLGLVVGNLSPCLLDRRDLAHFCPLLPSGCL